jgi:hypothetical protein
VTRIILLSFLGLGSLLGGCEFTSSTPPPAATPLAKAANLREYRTMSYSSSPRRKSHRKRKLKISQLKAPQRLTHDAEPAPIEVISWNDPEHYPYTHAVIDETGVRLPKGIALSL